MSATRARTVEVTKRVRGEPDVAFAYFTEPAKHVLWQGVAADLDPRPGGDYVVHFNERTRVRGTFVVADRPHRIVLRWGWESTDQFPPGTRDLSGATTTVEISFVPDGDGTIINLRHTDLPSEESEALTDSTWSLVLDRLVSVASGADPGPDPIAAYLSVPDTANATGNT